MYEHELIMRRVEERLIKIINNFIASPQLFQLININAYSQFLRKTFVF